MSGEKQSNFLDIQSEMAAQSDARAASGDNLVLVWPPKTADPSGKQSARKLNRDQLANKINFFNFSNRPILLVLIHQKYDRKETVAVIPSAVVDGKVHCIWNDTIPADLASYTLNHVILPDSLRSYRFTPQVITCNSSGLYFVLPEEGHELSARQLRREPASDIEVTVFQNGAGLRGHLADFNAVSLRVLTDLAPPLTPNFFRSERSVSIILKNRETHLYSGNCRIMKKGMSGKKFMLILEPLDHNIQRFTPKSFRSTRHKLVPSPNICFDHPFSGRKIDLKVQNISGTGFAVEEEVESSVLTPGLIVPSIVLRIASSAALKCAAQVIYRNLIEGTTKVRCGLSILDMKIEQHVELLSLLQQACDEKAYICNDVDLDELWNFFFDTGFIYPGKYEQLQTKKSEYQNTYLKLYNGHPEIARHFVYQDNGRLFGHMAMLRFQYGTWLIHHHAAKHESSRRVGVQVLNQLCRSIIDSHQLYASHMDYLACYYRPENKFPNKVFGGASKYINDPSSCSVDEFAYSLTKNVKNMPAPTENGWELKVAGPTEIATFCTYYSNESGGLLTKAFDIEDTESFHCLIDEYEQAGFKRKRRLLAVTKDGSLQAFIIANEASIGMNLSQLTNSITFFILEPDTFPADRYYAAISSISNMMKEVDPAQTPVLTHPVSYMKNNCLPLDKIYHLFVISTLESDRYFSYLKTIFRGNIN